MSAILDSVLTKEQREECARNDQARRDAEAIAEMFPLGKKTLPELILDLEEEVMKLRKVGGL